MKDIVVKKVSELKPYGKNSRKHPDKQIKILMKSIHENGFNSVLIIDENDMVLAGHGRLEALKRLCIDTVPCKVVTNLTDSQKKHFIISDNQIGLMSEWDKNILLQELQEISLDVNPIDIGFDEKFLSKLFDDTAGISIIDEIEEVFEGSIKVVFNEAKRIEVMNAVAEAVKDISGVTIWCDDEQIQGQENQ